MLRGRPGQPEFGICVVRTFGGEQAEPLVGAVGRAVVDENDFELVGGQRLAVERVDEGLEHRARVVGRDDHSDQHGHDWPATVAVLGSNANAAR